MKRGWKLLIMLCVLGALVGGYFILDAVNANQEEAETVAADTEETVEITIPEKSDIVGISYEYDGETVALTREDSTADWVYADDDAFPLDQTYPAQMLAVIDALEPTREFSGGNLADYGLDEPDVIVNVTDIDGNEYQYSIGAENELTYEYYMATGDSDMIYTVDSSLLDNFSYGLFDLIETEDVPAMNNVESIDVTTGTRSVVLNYDPDANLSYSDAFVWYSDEDGQTYPLGTDEVESLMDDLNAMTWRACLSYNADKSTLGTYGLEEPAATIVVRYMADVTTATGETDENGDAITTTTSEERAFTLELGSFVGDYCYARLGGSSMVYTIDATLADELMLAGYSSLRSSTICALDFDTVGSMDITIDGETHTIVLGTETVEVTDTDSDSDDDTATTTTTQDRTFTLDGETADNDLGDALLDAIGSITWNGDTADSDAGSLPEVTIVFHRTTDTFTDMELTLSRYGSTAYRVMFEGADGLLVSADYVTALTDAFDSLSESVSE